MIQKLPIELSSDLKNYWRLLSVILIITFTIVFVLLAAMTPTAPMGESDDYMAAELALENHFSLQILESDVEEARMDFPEHYEYIKSSWEIGGNRFFISQNGDRYPWYMGTYSLACIPVKLLLDFLGLNQSYAFALTNVFLFIGVLIFTYQRLRVSDRSLFLTILLLACSPIVLYYFWPSAEMFIFSFVVIALVHFVNGSYKLSALFISIVGTLNPTIMVLGVAIIIDYFIKLLKTSYQLDKKNILIIFKQNFIDIFKFGVCFLPFFITYIFNYTHFGIFNLQSSLGLVRSQYWLGRFSAYLFDLNFGFLPYYLIAFILFIGLLIYGIVFKKNTRSIAFAIGFFGTIGAYAITWHINCGMTGIARYNAWAAPILIFFLTTQLEKLFNTERVKKIIAILLIVSAVYTSLVVYIIRTSEHGMEYTYMSPIATWVLDNYPSLYNPYPFTFISRVLHQDGGYWGDWGNESIERNPVIYSDENGYIRKILLMAPIDIKKLESNIIGNENDLNKLEQKLKELEALKKYQYLDFDKEISLIDISNVKGEFDPVKYKDLTLSCRGIYGNEGNFHWCSQDAIIRLRADNKKTTGIVIKYAVNQALFDMNNLDEYKFDIVINGKYIKTEYLTKAGDFELRVNNYELPDDNAGIYEIELRTNASFSPVQYGNYNDTRDLSIVLFYIG
jgi:hypothetical protein